MSNDFFLTQNINAAIFDVDGTILDSMPFWENSENLYLEKLGIKTNENLHSIFSEMTIQESSLYIKNKFNPPFSQQEIIDIILGCAKNFYFNEVKLKGKVFSVLKSFYQNKIPMIVATATEKKFVQKSFERLGIAHFFKDFITTTDVGSGKNSAAIFVKCASILGENCENVLVVEDSLHAIKTAKKAQFKVAAIYDESSKNLWNEIKKNSDFSFMDFDEMLYKFF